MKRARLTENQRMVAWGVAFVLLNLAFALFHLWQRWWIIATFFDFTVIVIFLQWLDRFVPPHRKAVYERALALGFSILTLLAWEAIVRVGILNPQWFPPPTRIARGLWNLTVNYDKFTETSLLGRPWLIPSRFATQSWPGVIALFAESHVWATLMRIFAGFILGTIPGLIIGVAMGVNRTIRIMLDPIISALYVLPKIAIFPLLMLVFPNPFGEGPKIAAVAIAAFFLVLINTMAGVRGIEPVFIEVGKNYGCNRWQMLRHVIIPGALPVIFAGLRLALGTALIVIVAIEFVRARKGVGYITLYYWEVMVTEKMYAGLVIVMILGILLTFGLQWVERMVIPWRREERPI